MTIWKPVMRRGLPRYLAIAEALGDDVAAARLVPGTQMPTHRDLADRLAVTVGTVSRAYAEAARRRLITGEVGRGTFVRGRVGGEPGVAAEADDAGVGDMSVNHPPPVAGMEAAALRATLAALSRRGDVASMLAYPPDAGSRAHREAGAEWLAR